MTSVPEQRRWRMGLTNRTLIVVAVVAVLSALLAGLVSYPLVLNASRQQARATLALLADLTAGSLTDNGGGDRDRDGDRRLPPALVDALLRERVDGYIVTSAAGTTPPEGTTAADVTAVTTGNRVSTDARSGGEAVFVEGRPLSDGVGILLVQPVDVARTPAGAVLTRLALALLIGLAIALIVGIIAARRVTRPLRVAADAALRLSRGERDVAVEPRGPAEVAALADSLNRLNAALVTSEGRQREFLLSVSHELRTPLTAVRGYAEALADGVVDGEDVARTGSIVRSEADRLDRLVSDLLVLARLDAVDFQVHPVEVDLGEFGREAAAVWADRCDRAGCPFTADLPTWPLAVHTDPVRLRQIIDNLAENALRVTPEGRPIALSLRSEGAWAVIEVRDGGPGLTADDAAVAFEPGVLHERYRGIRQVGTGLGLALVGRLTAALGGQVEAGAAPEGGARFTVRLPLGG